MNSKKGYINLDYIMLTMYIPFIIKIYQLQRDVIKDLANNEYVREIYIDAPTSTITITIKYQNTTIPDSVLSISANDFVNTMISHFGNYINVVGTIEYQSSVSGFENRINNAIDFTKNAIFFYRNNSSKDTVSKSLIWVATEEVKYTRPIQYKQMILDVKRSASDSQYNYVYLTVLNRYYYVTDAVLTNDYASLTLIEDVLMSFSDLIRLQDAFVTRNENDYDSDKVDDYVTYDYDKTITTQTVTDSLNLFENIGTVEQMDYRYVLTVISKV